MVKGEGVLTYRTSRLVGGWVLPVGWHNGMWAGATENWMLRCWAVQVVYGWVPLGHHGVWAAGTIEY